jgi:hypothetical protein
MQDADSLESCMKLVEISGELKCFEVLDQSLERSRSTVENELLNERRSLHIRSTMLGRICHTSSPLSQDLLGWRGRMGGFHFEESRG